MESEVRRGPSPVVRRPGNRGIEGLAWLRIEVVQDGGYPTQHARLAHAGEGFSVDGVYVGIDHSWQQPSTGGIDDVAYLELARRGHHLNLVGRDQHVDCAEIGPVR